MKINSPTPRQPLRATAQRTRAFSLLEVMIAIGILFIGTFAILSLISSSLENVRRLQHTVVDASAPLSMLSPTNKLVEGVYSGNLGDALGKAHDQYKWSYEIREVRSNRLFQVDCVIQNAYGGNEIIGHTITLMYRPASPPGSMDGGNFGQ